MRQPEPVRCATCGYDLTGLADDGRCPECALAIETSLARHRSRYLSAAADRVVIEHRDCVGCKYDLYGLPIEGVCPECSAPVRDSFGAHLLRYGPPKRLSRLADSAALLAASGWVLLVGVCLWPAIPLGLVLMLVGWWGLTPTPERTTWAKGEAPRRLTRLGVVLTALAAACAGSLIALRISGGVSEEAAWWAGGAAAAMLYLTTVAGMWHARGLALRVPDGELRGNATAAAYCAGLVPVLASVSGLAWVLRWTAWGGLVVVVLFLACLAWLLIVHRVLLELRVALRDECRYVVGVKLGVLDRAAALGAAAPPEPTPAQPPGIPDGADR